MFLRCIPFIMVLYMSMGVCVRKLATPRAMRCGAVLALQHKRASERYKACCSVCNSARVRNSVERLLRCSFGVILAE